MKKGDKDFEPHPMFEPKTGKYMVADTYEEHMIFKELGLVHEDDLKDKPKKEKAVVISFMDAVESGMGKGE
tara:strand:+ start:688 stop:900 length:213 start_codon:yes stop_codon:yes gene_type:complete